MEGIGLNPNSTRNTNPLLQTAFPTRTKPPANLPYPNYTKPDKIEPESAEIQRLMKIQDFIEETAKEAGKISIDIYQAEKTKGTLDKVKGVEGYDIVTIADIAVEEFINKQMIEKFGEDICFFGEETVADGKEITHCDLVKGITICCDPIDGTKNYSRGHEHYAVSIAYAENGIVKVGVVHAPLLGKTYSACKGGGAYLNGNKIKVAQPPSSKESLLKDALLITGFPRNDGMECFLEKNLLLYSDFTQNHRASFRELGCCAIEFCKIAEGCFNGFYSDGNKPWDVAAGRLIIIEAGGCIDHFGDPGHQDLPIDFWSSKIIASDCPERLMSMKNIITNVW